MNNDDVQRPTTAKVSQTNEDGSVTETEIVFGAEGQIVSMGDGELTGDVGDLIAMMGAVNSLLSSTDADDIDDDTPVGELLAKHLPPDHPLRRTD